MISYRKAAVGAFGLSCALAAAPEHLMVVSDLAGRTGDRFVYTQRTELRTPNPVTVAESASREVINRLFDFPAPYAGPNEAHGEVSTSK